jgi:hypothetical protein
MYLRPNGAALRRSARHSARHSRAGRANGGRLPHGRDYPKRSQDGDDEVRTVQDVEHRPVQRLHVAGQLLDEVGPTVATIMPVSGSRT